MSSYFRITPSRFVVKWIVLSLWAGLLGGLGAVAFTVFLDLNMEFFYSLVEDGFLLLIPILPALGGLMVGIVNFFFNKEAFYTLGASESALEAIHERQGFVSPKKPFVTILTSSLSIGTGNSVGKEFPAVDIGVGFGSIARRLIEYLGISRVVRWLKITRRDSRIMAICGASSALAGVFGAPLGGGVFGSEVIYQEDVEVAALGPALLSSCMGVVVCWLILGHHVPFHVPHIEDMVFLNPNVVSDLCNFALTVGLGVVCGLAAVVFVKFFYLTAKVFRLLKVPAVARPALGGLLNGLLVLAVYLVARELYLWGLGYDAIEATIAAEVPVFLLLLLFFTKMAATSFVICSGGAGGTLIPSFFLGAVVGGLYFYALSGLAPCMSNAYYAAYVTAGICAFSAATARIPMSSVLLVCEMARNFTVMPSLLTATIVAFFVTRPFGITIYRAQRRRRVGLTRKRRFLDFLLWLLIVAIGVTVYRILGFA